MLIVCLAHIKCVRLLFKMAISCIKTKKSRVLVYKILFKMKVCNFERRNMQEPEYHVFVAGESQFVFCRLFSDVQLQHSEKLQIKVRGSVWYYF